MGPSVKFVLCIASMVHSQKRKLGVVFFIRKNTKPGGCPGRFGESPDFSLFFCETFPYVQYFCDLKMF